MAHPGGSKWVPWWLVAAMGAGLGCASGQGLEGTEGTEGPSEATAGGEGEATARRVLVGGCTETEVDGSTRRVDAQNAGWAYFIPADARAQCEETRAFFTISEGLNVVVTSFVAEEGSDHAHTVAEVMLAAAANEVRQIDAGATIDDRWEGTFGESEVPGLCSAADFSAEGVPLRSLACAGWVEREGGVVHMILMALSDRPGAMEKAGLTDESAFGAMVDSLAFPER